jgi:hypothetical protein
MANPGNFVASQDGFAFTNAWPSEPAVVLPTPFGQIDIGNAAAGLCGGMVFAAVDYWHAGIVPPANPTRSADNLRICRLMRGFYSRGEDGKSSVKRKRL